MSQNERRKHVSFKDNVRDKMLLEWALDQSYLYGFSGYVKKLIEDDMKRQKKEEGQHDYKE
jgi:hypothetical protein